MQRNVLIWRTLQVKPFDYETNVTLRGNLKYFYFQLQNQDQDQDQNQSKNLDQDHSENMLFWIPEAGFCRGLGTTDFMKLRVGKGQI